MKKNIIRVLGSIAYARFRWLYKVDIKGAEVLQNLPDKNVLFISNHQTYFADVAFFLHVFHAALNDKPNALIFPGFINPKHNIYYVAAEETMKSGLLPKLLALSGAVTINRTWRANGENVRRKVDRKEIDNIDLALKDGWLITFPQGTTKPFVKGRKGTAFIIKKHNPVVVPIVIDGFRRAFDKKGLKTKKRKSTLKMVVKEPILFKEDMNIDQIMEKLMDEIEQSEKFSFFDQAKKENV
ncbi:lysophospholipid acyltransferase family protein [Putridiphycobacter roseus]|uniref:lysophospholipid acyltransferase family protein n=1 Tax=Putridiphycobacter roseus TaxID=2219161 RepID=UPI001F455CCB|nr:lysophospholipid acyltransferase family protein [Putridiphycobacter roseus]